MRVLVIGGGGREHALAWKLRQSPLLGDARDLLCVPGNAGTAGLATCIPEPSGGLSDISGLADLAREHRIDLTVVGPEMPLTLGLVDEFAGRGLKVFGATRAAARIEGSKVFAKQFMARHQIPTAAFETFTTSAEAIAWLGSDERVFPLVVKADGLAAGKGVFVAADKDEAVTAVRTMMEEERFGPAGAQVVIEECLVGVEASFFAFTDGERAVPLATCQDYKRARDGDQGPNTGGMGAYSPSVELDERLQTRIMDTVIRPTVRGLAAEGAPYRGILYAGLMLGRTGDGGLEAKVLEFNARFGDPETQVLMPRIEGDLLPALASVAEGSLDEKQPPIAWRSDWAATVVMASRGYPESSENGVAIHGLDAAASLPETVVFHAGTRVGADGRTVETAGGRVLAVSALGSSLAEALGRAYDGVGKIEFDGMHFRKDIGRGALARLALRGAGRRPEDR